MPGPGRLGTWGMLLLCALTVGVCILSVKERGLQEQVRKKNLQKKKEARVIRHDLKRLRKKISQLEQQLQRSKQITDELHQEVIDTNRSISSTLQFKPCHPACQGNGGTCDGLSGKCQCGMTRRGSACEEPTMPACSLGEGPFEVINLSYLVSESLWDRTNNIVIDDPIRSKVNYVWLGPIPCECVAQAANVFSLEHSPQPAIWPSFIGQTEVGLRRILCIDVDVRSSVRDVWNRGENLSWSYVPLFAWKKQFPSHGPQIVALGMLAEHQWMFPPKNDWLLRLKRDTRTLNCGHYNLPCALGQLRPRLQIDEALGLTPGQFLELRPARDCGEDECGGLGWCGQWISLKSRPKAALSCHCVVNFVHDAELLQQKLKEKKGERLDMILGQFNLPGSRTCEPVPQPDWIPEMDQLVPENGAFRSTNPWVDELIRYRDRYGPEYWRVSHKKIWWHKACPNACRGHGICTYGGYCHCAQGFWGLDCGFNKDMVQSFDNSPDPPLRPRIYIYPTPVGLRRSCGPWRFPEDLADFILKSPYNEPRAEKADVFWYYGCPNGDMFLPAVDWIKKNFPWWNKSVADNVPRHVVASPQEEGIAEIWGHIEPWLRNRDVSNRKGTWNDMHPASYTRQLVMLQLAGKSDYIEEKRVRAVTFGAPCRVCFQPGKDIMIPGFPGINDYPDPRNCRSLNSLTSGALNDTMKRERVPTFFLAGALQTKTHGPGLYEPSRVVPYSCWKNRSNENGFMIVQTERSVVAVHPWQIEQPVASENLERQASMCGVPEGKIGSYGHRALRAIMLGCVPVITKELVSHNFFDEVINWTSISLHVPPVQMPYMLETMRKTSVEQLRETAIQMRRRLLWTRLYGTCHLRHGQGGDKDAIDTLLENLRIPRRHFAPSKEHAAPHAPELLMNLYPWLRKHGGSECTRSAQCFDEYNRSCAMDSKK